MQLHQQIARWLAESRRIVAFTGAGISTESGIPDFRSPQGIWARSKPVYFDQFLASAEARYEYWRQKAESHRDMFHSRPNPGHQVLAQWERSGRLQAVITQNIDGLHQQAGSRKVLELHGTARQIGCLQCHRREDADPLIRRFLDTDTVPTCVHCGGLLKHATVSFGQTLPAEVLQEAMLLSQQCDLFLALGSSLVVEPAASLPRLAQQHSARLVIINGEPTGLDHLADATLNSPLGETLTAIDAQLGPHGKSPAS